MITLTDNGNSIKFTFDDCPQYLYNGVIEVPKNALTMVIDESGMVTFRKSASNDIFLSCFYSELGMSKNEVEAWYQEHGVKDTPSAEEVEDMIEDATQDYFDGAEYDSNSKRINFKHGSTIKGYIDASDFVIDGMVDDVEIENGYLVITFNTDSGKQPISIPLTDIFNPNNYYDKTATDALLATKADTATTYTKSEVDAALSGKQDTLIAGSGITISGNVISSEGGGGKAISAGTNISITTGETADTINCTLPITKIQGYNSVIIGDSRNTVNGDCNVAVGSQNSINHKGYSYTPEYCFVGGYFNNVYNSYETAFGKYNNSVQDTSVGGESGTTLFSVGNGANNARHNAFEIRKNGDIYLTKDGQDVKLQDQLGGGGNNVVTLTQAEYDSLVDKDPTAFYIISDAEEIDLNNYYTKSETSGATQISTALSGKQDTLVSGTNIKTINNESLLGSGNINIQGGGGGKAIEGGRGISITTGETADTVSFNLPISADTNYNITMGGRNSDKGKEYNFLFGNSNAVKTPTKYNGNYNCLFGFSNTIGKAQGRYATQYNAVFGYNNYCSLNNSLICGNSNNTYNNSEFSSGQFNNSVSGSSTFGDSGNTLFSVGNGTSSSARHNAFEIRQNGDIYISSGGTDILLQDHLGGGGGSSYTAGDGIDITNDVISVTGKVDTSAITTSITSSSTDAQVPSAKAVNDKLGGLNLVKLTQSEYSAMEQAGTLDNSTLYIVIDS